MLPGLFGERGVLPLLDVPETAKGSEAGLAAELRGAAAKSVNGSPAEVGAGAGMLKGSFEGFAGDVAKGSLWGVGSADAPNGSDALRDAA